jgi:hypothetical protein
LPKKIEQREFFKTWINGHFRLNDQFFSSSSQIFLGRPKIQSPPMMTKSGQLKNFDRQLVMTKKFELPN